jgi:hypothetical protein
MSPVRRRLAHGRLRSAPGSLGGRLFLKSITDRPHGPDEIGTARGPQSISEAANVNIDCPGAEMNVSRPGRNLKVAAGMDATWIPHEVDQQTKLGRREMNDLSIAPHDVRGEVNLEIVECQYLRGFGMARRMPQCCEHACDELFRHERPPEALVSARRKEFLAVAFITRSQEHHDREGSRLLFEAELRAQGSHVDPDKTRVHQKNGRLEFPQPLRQPFSVRLCEDLNPDLPKDVDDKGAEPVVFGRQQDGRRRLRSDRVIPQHLIKNCARCPWSALRCSSGQELGTGTASKERVVAMARLSVTGRRAKIGSGTFGEE